MLRSPKRTFTLSNVLYIPHITKPLLSVQKIYCDNNVYFKFHASVFYIKDLSTKTMLLSGHSNDSFYVLSESSTTTISQICWSPCISATTNQWHRRLGHPTSRIFNLLVFKNKIMCTSRRSLVQCQTCLLCRSLRLSLRPTGHKITAPLDLIFNDVWGPAPMFSSNSFRYFIIFIDAHTKYIWYFLLVAKSDVFSIFQCF